MPESNLLEGVRIVDFSRLLPGPLATKLLQQQGAEITKIELGKKGDWLKFYPTNHQFETSTYYRELNEKKNIIEVDLELPDTRRQIENLIQSSDILIEQFRPGVLDSLGFGYLECKRLNPDIIYISLTGYGQHSDQKHKPGHDINFLAESGVLALLKNSDGKPILPNVQLADIAAGSFPVVTACFAGLYHRSRVGSAIHMDVSIMEGLKPFRVFAERVNNDHEYTTPGFLNGGLVNYNIYKTSDNKYVALGALELKFWNKFCTEVGHEDWKRNQLAELTTDQFDRQLVSELFASKPAAFWNQLSKNHDLCLSVVVDPEMAKRKNALNRKCIL